MRQNAERILGRLDEGEQEDAQVVYDLVRPVVPGVELRGYLVMKGNVTFDPIRNGKWGHPDFGKVAGVQISSVFSWTPFYRVMLNKDGKLDHAKMQAKVKQMEDFIHKKLADWKAARSGKTEETYAMVYFPDDLDWWQDHR